VAVGPIGTSYINRAYKEKRSNARRREISFELTITDFRTLSCANCFYCGQRPELKCVLRKNQVRVPISGIDRLDRTKGYILSNCVAACTKCNMSKGILDLGTFLKMVGKIYAKHRYYFAFLEDNSGAGTQVENKTKKKSKGRGHTMPWPMHK